MGRQIRSCIIAKEGYKLISSPITLRFKLENGRWKGEKVSGRNVFFLTLLKINFFSGTWKSFPEILPLNVRQTHKPIN